jgi:hypothetical protein
MSDHFPLSAEQIQSLEQRGCSAEDWATVHAVDGFDPERVRNVQFAGAVRLGRLQGRVDLEGGVQLPAALADATLVDCVIGDDVLIARVGSHIANYTIADGAVITDIGTLVTRADASFGNGVEAETINEGGGREVALFAELSSQFAYLLAMYRHNAKLTQQLQGMVAEYARQNTHSRGTIGAGARLAHIGEITDVQVGPAARIIGAARLCNGTILSEAAAPTHVGAGVSAEDFILAEGASVKDSVVLHSCFVGQGVQLGKQFSAENSLFFANCEGFHGEACSIFAGPYTVTHHKSTLLIAGIYSFYNAGSGTNQSNHMYKLGPVHQGVIHRGTKNGSFSYMRWPTVVGPFCVIIGKHLNNFDIGDLPFSYVTEEGGESLCTPAMNMFTVGTVRDGDKWPSRDRRTATVKRDQIGFAVYGPYTVGKMIAGETALNTLYEATARDVEQVRYKGVIIKRLLLRRSARNYASGIDAYLQGKVLARAAEARAAGDTDALRQALSAGGGIFSAEWADIGGLLMPRERLLRIEGDIESGKLSTPAQVDAAFAAAHTTSDDDEWEWVRAVWQQRTGGAVEELSLAELDEIDQAHKKASSTFVKKILADAEKEFDPIARFGYGADAGDEARDSDFAAVRGTFESNSFVRQMQERLDS